MIQNKRMLGISDHIARAEYFFQIAKKQKDANHRRWYLLAANYSLAAIRDLVFNESKFQSMNELKSKFENDNFMNLIHQIRLEDFHRLGVLLDSHCITLTFGNRNKSIVTEPGDIAGLVWKGDFEKKELGAGKVYPDKPLVIANEKIYLEADGQYYTLENIIEKGLEFVHSQITQQAVHDR